MPNTNPTESDDTFTTIAQLVDHDYDGSEDIDAGAARNILRTWFRNNVSARAMIDSRGLDRAVAEYIAAWDDAYRTEYALAD